MLNNLCSSKIALRLSIVVLGCILLVSCSYLLEDHRLPSPGSQSRVQKAVDSVRIALEEELGNSVPSLNLYIQTPAEKIFASSVPTGSVPLTENTNFRFASNTKTFTATAILKMHQDKWLDFKAKIANNVPGTDIPYVPNTSAWDFPYKNEITIEQLLQHSAGVYDVDNDPVPGYDGQSYTEYTQGLDPNHQFTAEELVDPLVRFKLSFFAPGTGYHYSNTGYTILGSIIARVYSIKSGSPKTYEDYLRDHIVGPGTAVPVALHFPVRANDTAMPAPYATGTERLPGKTILYGDYNMSAQVAEGNGYGSPASLNTFMRKLMKGENVLTPETVHVMQSNVSAKNPNYALGCFYTKNMGFGHNGARCGTLSLAMYDPATDVSVVAYINLVDLTKGNESFIACLKAIYGAAWGGRAALGYSSGPK